MIGDDLEMHKVFSAPPETSLYRMGLLDSFFILGLDIKETPEGEHFV